MASGRRITAGGAAAATAIVLIFAATWVLLDRTEHRPGWLTVEAPPAAVVGQPLEIRVNLNRSVEATQIVCTLHRAGADRRLREHIASSGPAREAAGGLTHVFRFDVPEKENLIFVSAVIFLSPTGDWRDRTRAAHTRLIPVEPGGSVSGLAKARVFHSASAAEDEAAELAARRPRLRPSVWVHPVLSVILLSAALLCGAKAGRKRPQAGPREKLERTIWLTLSALLALGAFLELSGLAGHIAAWGRRLAQEQNLYDVRKTYQKAIMSAVAAAGFGLSILFIRAVRKPGSQRFLLWVGIGFAAYLSVSFAGVLSFHAVDVVRGMTRHGISPVDAVRGAGALASLFAAFFAVAAKTGKPRG